MVTDKTEEEQVEALKQWFATNGTSLAVGIVLSLAAVFGYQTWESSTREYAENASALYESLTAALAVEPMGELSEEQRSTAEFIAGQLKTEYSDTTYAQFAAMHLAKLAVERTELETAATELQWALDQANDSSLAPLIRLRLAQVKLAQGEYDASLALLDLARAGVHTSAFAEARGDIYYAMDQLDEARESYQLAVNNQAEGMDRPMLKMKLEDLALPSTDVPVDAGAETDADSLGETPAEAATDEDASVEDASVEATSEEDTLVEDQAGEDTGAEETAAESGANS